MKNTRIISYATIITAIMGLALFVAPSVSAAYYYPGYNYPGYNYGTPVYYQYQTAPVYTYSPAPVYAYAPISASCYAMTATTYVGSPVTWMASVSGGNGLNYVSWTGDEGLSGYGSSISKTYSYPGYKSASATITSGGQTITVNCSGSVNVLGPTYYPSQQQFYNNETYYYPPTQQTSYYTAPTTYVNQAPAPSSNANGLEIGCYVDPTNATVNQPVTWNVEVTGGQSPYTYSWTGSDNLSGTQSSVIKYYSTTGQKSAIVTVTSADGRSTAWSCSNEVTITNGNAGGSYAYARPVRPAAPAPQQPSRSQSQLGAASALSLASVPWGWVAVLIILVLFFTVLYLLFNRTKI